METLAKFLTVAAGGAFGAAARYAISSSFLAQVSRPFPLPTFIINVSGSFFIGLLLVLFVERFALNDYWRLFFVVGFLGAYTTFSTFEFETLRLLQTRELATAGVYAISSLICGLFGVWLGATLGKL